MLEKSIEMKYHTINIYTETTDNTNLDDTILYVEVRLHAARCMKVLKTLAGPG